MHHEGTWITWPHKYADKQSYYFGEEGIDGEVYAEMLEPTWVEITKALHTGETVHIIAYNDKEKTRIEKLLKKNIVKDLDEVMGITVINPGTASESYAILEIENGEINVEFKNFS